MGDHTLRVLVLLVDASDLDDHIVQSEEVAQVLGIERTER